MRLLNGWLHVNSSGNVTDADEKVTVAARVRDEGSDGGNSS